MTPTHLVLCPEQLRCQRDLRDLASHMADTCVLLTLSSLWGHQPFIDDETSFWVQMTSSAWPFPWYIPAVLWHPGKL